MSWGISTADMDSDAGAGKILGVCLEKGVQLADECIREDLDNPVRYVEESVKSIMEAVACAEKRDEKTRLNYRNSLRYVTAVNAETLEDICNGQVFGSAGTLKYATEICERALEVLTPLHEMAKKYSYAITTPENWIKVDIDFMQRLLEKTCKAYGIGYTLIAAAKCDIINITLHPVQCS